VPFLAPLVPLLVGITCLVLLLASAQAHAAPGAGALQYDDSEAARRFNMIRLYVDTRHCMRGSVVAGLRLGSRDRAQLARLAVSACGAPFRAEIVDRGGFAEDKADALLKELAAASIDEVAR
jgi:hypothetical protein